MTRSRVRTGRILAALVVLFQLLSCTATAVVSSTTSVPQQYETSYATIYYSDERELFSFTRSLGNGLSFITDSPRTHPALLRQRVDKLTMKVMKILDMLQPNLHFSISVYGNQADIENAHAALVHDSRAPAAFYDNNRKNIAVSSDRVTQSVLAHEIAHAVICSYFDVPPPARTQEIIAQYVDKQLKDDE